ncbi:hypothetical protein ABTX24_09365 [Nocardioides sp. NPDC127514]|uniref:hypothetical protein n=1 Tax=unclassified Nocardioides TaxID=2615069 RepID=UPI00331D685B
MEQGGTDQTNSGRRGRPLDWLSGPAGEHLGLLVSGGVFLLISIQILAVAGYDVTTALAVVQAGGAANIALGTALASAPLVATFVLAYGVTRYVIGSHADPDRYWRWAPFISVGVLCTFIVQWTVLAVIAVWIALHRLGVYWRKKHPRPSDSSAERSPMSSAERRAWRLFPLLVFLPTLGTSWMPAEHLSMTDGTSVNGYVVSASGGELTMVQLEPKKFVRIAAASVSRRQVCAKSSSFWSASVVGSLKEPVYKECPEEKN